MPKYRVVVTGPTPASTVEKPNRWRHEAIVSASDMDTAKWIVCTRPPVVNRAISDCFGYEVND